jgi:hypothetical protein
VLTKPMAWRGSSWTVKNLLELKAARRVIIRDNTLSNLWANAANGNNGYAVWFKTVNQDGTCTKCVVEDVLFEKNRLTNVSAGLNLHKDPGANGRWGLPANRITVRDNLIETASATLAGRGICLLQQGVDDTVFEFNTCHTDGASAISFDGATNQRMVIRGNILLDLSWGIKGTAMGEGVATLTAFAPGHVFEKNLIVSAQPTLYAPLVNTIVAVYPDETTGFGMRR